MRAPTATARINSPIGVISMTATDAALIGIRILPRERGEMLADDHPVLVSVVKQMRAYFDACATRQPGRRRAPRWHCRDPLW
jgi:hypothetical protein